MAAVLVAGVALAVPPSLVGAGAGDSQAEAQAPRRPSREEVLDYRGHLANLKDAEGRVIWTPALPGATEEVKHDWLARIAAAGGTHVPIGPFTPGAVYPGIPWDNPDWTNDAAAIRRLVESILSTPTPDGHGLIPVLFLDSGTRAPRPRLARIYPVVVRALDGLWDAVVTVPAGWEPLAGGWKSIDVSWALERWHQAAPGAIVAFHGAPGWPTGASRAPHEPDDPWQGDERRFFTEAGGEFVDMLLYQTPHGPDVYESCGPADQDCYLARWAHYVERIGAGGHGWRQLRIVAFETCAYEFFREQVDAGACRDVAARMQAVCAEAGVACGFGNGLPPG